jgi:hypothetical protein
VKSLVTFALLTLIKAAALVFYRHRVRWVGEPLPQPWKGIRLTAILNHTSLYEPVLVGGVPLSFLWRLARHGLVPIADKTRQRPVVGRFFRLVARHVVPITRKADHTWAAVLERVHDPDSMVVILPEGRMKRRNGLDSHGQPMTVRGGVADLLLALPGGRLLIAYSGGLHHIQAPGEAVPRLFRTVRMDLEALDLAVYRDGLLAQHGRDGFKAAVIADLERRRDLYCDPLERLNASEAVAARSAG